MGGAGFRGLRRVVSGGSAAAQKGPPRAAAWGTREEKSWSAGLFDAIGELGDLVEDGAALREQ